MSSAGTLITYGEDETITVTVPNNNATGWVTVSVNGSEIGSKKIGTDGKATVSTYSGSGKVSVTQGNPILVNVKDKPKTTKLSVVKSSSDVSASGSMPNSDYDFTGTTYELYKNADHTGKAATFVMKSDGKTDTTFETA